MPVAVVGHPPTILRASMPKRAPSRCPDIVGLLQRALGEQRSATSAAQHEHAAAVQQQQIDDEAQLEALPSDLMASIMYLRSQVRA